MTDATEHMSLGDIPDLSGLAAASANPDPFLDGWYKGQIVQKRQFTDSNGNDRVFETSDEPAQRSGRNIRLQLALTRQSDGRTMNNSVLLNYQPDDLTATTVQQITAHQEKVKDGAEWGPLFRSFMTLTRLSKLQAIAGVRQFQRNGNGGLDLAPLYGKIAWFKLGTDPRNEKYKEVKDYRSTPPTKVPVL